MSCYEWESGTIKLPTAAFARFRRELNSFYNSRQSRLFQKATAIFEKVTAETKGKKGVDLVHVLNAHLQENRIIMGFSSTVEVDGADEISDVLLPREDGKLKRPLKKDFAPVPLAGNALRGEDWSILFSPKAHSVHFSVPENNHACERAHEHDIVKQFFSMLGRVVWVRGTGGEIVGNDEYNTDSREAGGGGNYVKHTFGPQLQTSSIPALARRPLF